MKVKEFIEFLNLANIEKDLELEFIGVSGTSFTIKKDITGAIDSIVKEEKIKVRIS